MEATAKKKKDAKNLAFKMMAVKLGEILRLLKPQPGRCCFFRHFRFYPPIEVLTKVNDNSKILLYSGTVRTQLNEQIRVMLCDGPRGLFGTSRMPPLKQGDKMIIIIIDGYINALKFVPNSTTRRRIVLLMLLWPQLL